MDSLNQGVAQTAQASRMHSKNIGKDGKEVISIAEHIMTMPFALLFDSVPWLREFFPAHGVFGHDVFACIDPMKIMAQFTGDAALPGILAQFNPDHLRIFPEWLIGDKITLDHYKSHYTQADDERKQRNSQEDSEKHAQHQQDSSSREHELQGKRQQYEHEEAQERQQKNEQGLLYSFPGLRMSKQMEHERMQRDAQAHHVNNVRHGNVSPHQQHQMDFHEWERRSQHERDAARSRSGRR